MPRPKMVTVNAELLRTAFKRRNWITADLVEKTEIDRKTIAKMLEGKSVSTAVAAEVASAIDSSLDEFVVSDPDLIAELRSGEDREREVEQVLQAAKNMLLRIDDPHHRARIYAQIFAALGTLCLLLACLLDSAKPLAFAGIASYAVCLGLTWMARRDPTIPFIALVCSGIGLAAITSGPGLNKSTGLSFSPNTVATEQLNSGAGATSLPEPQIAKSATNTLPTVGTEADDAGKTRPHGKQATSISRPPEGDRFLADPHIQNHDNPQEPEDTTPAFVHSIEMSRPSLVHRDEERDRAIERCLALIRDHRLPNGGLARSAIGRKIDSDPRAACYGMLGLIAAARPEDNEMVLQWFEWWQSHIDPRTGVPPMLDPDRKSYAIEGDADPVNATAGLFLRAVGEYCRRLERTASPASIQAATSSLKSIESLLLPNGLSAPNHHNSHPCLIENLEAFHGVVSSTSFFERNNQPELAEQAAVLGKRLSFGLAEIYRSRDMGTGELPYSRGDKPEFTCSDSDVTIRTELYRAIFFQQRAPYQLQLLTDFGRSLKPGNPDVPGIEWWLVAADRTAHQHKIRFQHEAINEAVRFDGSTSLQRLGVMIMALLPPQSGAFADAISIDQLPLTFNGSNTGQPE